MSLYIISISRKKLGILHYVRCTKMLLFHRPHRVNYYCTGTDSHFSVLVEIRRKIDRSVIQTSFIWWDLELCDEPNLRLLGEMHYVSNDNLNGWCEKKKKPLFYSVFISKLRPIVENNMNRFYVTHLRTY